MKVLEYPDNMRKLVCKVSFHLHNKRHNLFQRAKDNSDNVDFHMLTSFRKQEAMKANNPIYGQEAMMRDQFEYNSISKKMTQKSKGSYASVPKVTQRTQESSKSESVKLSLSGTDKSSSGNKNAFHTPCLYCENKSHSLFECEKIKSAKFSDRIQFLKDEGLCFGCLKYRNQRITCRNKAAYGKFKLRRLTILYIDNYTPMSRSGVLPCEDGCKAIWEMLRTTVNLLQFQLEFACQIASKKLNGCLFFYHPGSNATFWPEPLIHGISGKQVGHQKMRITVDTTGVPQDINMHLIRGLEVYVIFKTKITVKIPEV